MSAALDRVSPTTSSDPSTSWLSPHMGAGQWRDSIAGIAASRSAGRSRRTSVDAQELSSPESRVHSWSDFGNLASSSSVSRGSLGGSSRDPWESAQSRTSHTSSSKSNSRAASDLYGYGPGSEQWWEHVLPPGQLAERLRRAQRSSDRGEAIDTVDSKPRRSGSSSLSGATRTERGVWTKLADLSKSDEVGAFSHRRRDGHGSQGRTQSLKGDGKKTPNGGNASGGVSADVSSDEYISSPGQRSPQALGGGHFGDYSDHELSSGHHSPFASFRPEHGLSWLGVERNSSIRSFSRSTTSRRSRVISEEGVGLGIGSIKAQEQPVQESKANSHGQTGQHLRRFPTSGYLSSSLSETPEGSSDDNSESRRSDTVSGARASDTATIRPKRTSAPASPRLRGVNEIPRPDFSRSPNLESNTLPRASRSRHVSFDGSADISTRLHRAEALPSSQSQFAVGGAGSSNPFKQASWNPERSFDSLPPRSSTFRRSRTGVRAQGDKRHPSFSAPTSRRGSIHLEDRPPLFGNATRKTGHRRTESHTPPNLDFALLDSLNVAQNQLATAGNLALTLTRQLSAPLRPVLHLTLFVSISSITLITLACFLSASYILTAFDDISVKSKNVGAAAGSARKNVEASISWGKKMLGTSPRPGSSSPDSGTFSNVGQSPRPDQPSASQGYDLGGGATSAREQSQSRSFASSAATWPIHIVWSSCTGIACRVLPRPMASLMNTGSAKGSGSDQAGARPQSSTRAGSGSDGNGYRDAPKASRLPPRPPLSLLLPSILFTLLIALGAGLASVFASRQAEAKARAQAQARAANGERRAGLVDSDSEGESRSAWGERQGYGYEATSDDAYSGNRFEEIE